MSSNPPSTMPQAPSPAIPSPATPPKGGKNQKKNAPDISQLITMKEKSKKSRRPFERDWYLNVAFLNSEQYVEYVAQTNKLIAIVPPEGATRTIRNEMFKIARTERAKILKIPPEAEAMPRTADQSDVMDARIANAYFKDLADAWRFPRRLRTQSYWVVATGNCFIKWYWCSDKAENDIAVVPPFDVFPDPYAHNMLDLRWLIHQQFMATETAREMYADVKGADISFITEGNQDSIGPLEARMFVAMGDGVANLPGSIINEYWEPPCKKNPEGWHIVFTQSGVVLQETFPYQHGKMPFTHTGHVERANSKWYSCIMDVERPLQMELNRCESQLIENRNMSNGKWFLPEGGELVTMPNAEPRQILQAKTGGPNWAPVLISPNPIPDWVHGEGDRIQGVMEDIAGQHEVSNAGVPGRVESAQAVQLLQETDDSVLKDTIESMNEAVAAGFEMCLQNWVQYGTPERMVPIYDKQGYVEVTAMKRDQMKVPMRILCKSTTALPSTTAGKWDRVLNLFQYKIIDGPTALNLLGLTPEEPDVDPTTVDRKKAYRENQLMKLAPPQPVRPDPSDNHGAHREEHDKFRKTAEYEALVAANPLVRQIFDFHDYEHELWDTYNQARAAQKQAIVTMASQSPTPVLPPPLDPPQMAATAPPPPPAAPGAPPGAPAPGGAPPPGPPGPPPPAGPPPGPPSPPGP